MSDLLQTVKESCQHAITAVKDASSRLPGTISTQALGVGVVVGFVIYHVMKKRYHLPPGPRPLPLLGNVLSVMSREQLYIKLARWARENYGPIISIYLGPVLCVTLNDLQSVNEALLLKGSDFAGRPFIYSLDVFTEGSRDIFLADYTPSWKLQRKICMQAIRHYMTGSHLEKAVHETVTTVADQMATESGPFDPHPYTTTLMFHIIDMTCFGESKPFDDLSIQKIIHLFDVVAHEKGNGFLEDIIPLLRYWPTKKFRKFIAAFQEFWDYLESNIQKHRERFSPDNVRDITDSLLLAQMEAAREESAEVMAMFTDVHLRETISDLFGAGVDTSRSTLDWAMLFMAGHPEVQNRAQAEIDTATENRMPGIGDRSKLQYTEAVLYETMRLGSVSPTAIPHRTLCDTAVGGYDVPKDTIVLVNLWAVSRDPKLWDQPEQFKPDRFLDDQGKLKSRPEGWMPFSVGRRACLGESVAKPELLLLLACFLKCFTISLPEGVKFEPDHEQAGFLIHCPKPYKIVVTPR